MPTAPATTPSTTHTASPVKDDSQRQALERSEKKAAQPQPENYKDKETEDKLVEIGPDVTADPIKGIDPEPKSPRKG